MVETEIVPLQGHFGFPLFDLSELLCCEQTRWSFASVLCGGWPEP